MLFRNVTESIAPKGRSYQADRHARIGLANAAAVLWWISYMGFRWHPMPRSRAQA
jgi:hypothetical protein